MSGSMESSHKKRRRNAPLVWGSSILAAGVLILGVNGTLSTWTKAVIDNNNNSVAATGAVSLIETGPGSSGVTCNTADDADNSVTCSGINKFGGIGASSTALADPNDPNLKFDSTSGAEIAPLTNMSGSALDPDSTTGGNTQSVKVNLENNGTVAGDLTLDAGTCKHYAYPGSTGADTADYDLCDQMELSVSCSDPTDTDGTKPAIYTRASGTVGSFTGTDKAIASLDPAQSTDCTFTVTLPADTPAEYASQYLTQDLSWTLAVPTPAA